jgi:hypothetical protein
LGFRIYRIAVMVSICQKLPTGQQLDSQGRSEGIFSDDFGKPKVAQLHGQVLICHQDILGFDVSMNNSPVVLFL